MSASTNTSAQQILLIRINNPFDPKDHVREELVWDEPAPLSRLAPVGQTECVYSLNGGVVEPENYATTIVSPGDCVVSCPILRGGGGDSKNVLRIVALIAVAVFAPYAAPAMGLTGAAATAMTIGVMVAGSLLVNSILPPVMPTASLGDGIGATTEASYGADGPKNVSRDGGIVPVVYGRYRMGGNLISSRTELVGTDQYLYLLLAMSEGPVASISDVLINDTPLSKFNNAWVQTRLGDNNQAPIDWFADNEVLIPRGTKLAHNSWVYHTTSGEVDKLKLNLLSPTGIGVVDESTGKTNAYTVNIEAQYRLLGTEEWRPFLSNKTYVIERRSVVPNEVVEVTKKTVAYYETRRYTSGRGERERFEQYRLRVPKVSYSKTIVFKSFKFSDTGEIVTDAEYIAQIRALIKADTNKKITDYYNSQRKKVHDDHDRELGRERSSRDAGDLGASDTDNRRGDGGSMMA